MIKIIPEAYYDSLYLSRKLTDYFDGFRFEEIYLFAYFAALLFLYKEGSINDWYYNFLPSNENLPFSKELYDSLMNLENSDYINSSIETSLFQITTEGIEEIERISKQTQLVKRNIYLETVCSTSIAIPYRTMINALFKEKSLKHASEKLLASGNREILINDISINALYDNFSNISRMIGLDTNTLIIPAMTWIDYLLQINGESQSE